MSRVFAKVVYLGLVAAFLSGCLVPIIGNLSANPHGSRNKAPGSYEARFDPNGVAIPGTQRFLTNSPDEDEHPIWSPDGRYIAFQRSRAAKDSADSNNKKYDVWIMRADGSEQRRLTFSPFDCQQPSWTPDSRSIAYRKAARNSGDKADREFDIYLVDVQTGRERPLIVYPGDDKHPVFSSDGKYLVFNSIRDHFSSNIYVVSANDPSAPPRRITKDKNLNDVHPAISKDGRQIVFHSYMLDQPPFEDEAPTKLGLVSFSGDWVKWLPVGRLLQPKHPFFTPDPDIITFHATDPESLHRNIYAMNIKKPGVVVKITDTRNAKHPQVSPDGRFLAYSQKRKRSKGDEGQYDISVVEIDFKTLQSLLK